MAQNFISKTVNLTGTEAEVIFGTDNPPRYYWIKNNGSDTVYFSMNPDIVPGADGVASVGGGSADGTVHGYPADRLYLLGTGTVEIRGTENAVSPFKSIPGGGDSPGGTENYNLLTNKPTVNGVVLSGDKSTADLIPLDSATMSVTDDGKLTAQPGIDGIEIGGRNLWTGTKDFTGDKWLDIKFWTVESEKFKGFTVLSKTSEWNGLYQKVTLFPGKKYVFCAYIRYPWLSSLMVSAFDPDNNWIYFTNFIVLDETDGWKKYICIIEPSVELHNVRYQNSALTKMEVCGFVLREINKIIDPDMLYRWVSSPEDKADVAYVNSELADIKGYIGYTDPDILGLEADFENNKFTRLAGAVGRNGGADFDEFPMFGGRRRCLMRGNGTVAAYYGSTGYKEDGTIGPNMVEQPKFYYKVVPLKLERIANGIGYHLRKARYYISAVPKEGFKLHPAFYDKNGNAIDKIYLSAFEAIIFRNSNKTFILDDSQEITESTLSNFCLTTKIGAKPCSGTTQPLTRANAEQLAYNCGQGIYQNDDWHIETIQTVSMNQLLMAIEYGTFNMQSAIGRGVVDFTDAGLTVYTGATSSLGNASGMASGENGKASVSYRGMENPYGNIAKFVNGINIKNNVAYICSDFNFVYSSISDDYKCTNILIPPSSGYISAFGYSEEFDWLFLPSELSGNNVQPIGDYQWGENADEDPSFIVGGACNQGDKCGMFYISRDTPQNYHRQTTSARLIYIPTNTEVTT